MSASSSAFGEKPVQLLEEFVLADSASREKMVADWAKGTPLEAVHAAVLPPRQWKGARKGGE
jgi:hypothetical protein